MFQIGILMKLQTEKYEIRGMQAKGKFMPRLLSERKKS
jgi:hypothetical protein